MAWAPYWQVFFSVVGFELRGKLMSSWDIRFLGYLILPGWLFVICSCGPFNAAFERGAFRLPPVYFMFVIPMEPLAKQWDLKDEHCNLTPDLQAHKHYATFYPFP